MVEKSKVELKPMVKDALQNLVIQDIRTAKEPIPLPLVRLSEKCISIYIRNEKTYQNHGIDYSLDSGEKNIKDVEGAISILRGLEVEKMIYDNPNKAIGGQVIHWRYPAVDGDATVLLSRFTDDVLSLTEIPRYEIKIMLERDVIGIAKVGEQGEAS